MKTDPLGYPSFIHAARARNAQARQRQAQALRLRLVRPRAAARSRAAERSPSSWPAWSSFMPLKASPPWAPRSSPPPDAAVRPRWPRGASDRQFRPAAQGLHRVRAGSRQRLWSAIVARRSRQGSAQAGGPPPDPRRTAARSSRPRPRRRHPEENRDRGRAVRGAPRGLRPAASPGTPATPPHNPNSLPVPGIRRRRPAPRPPID